MTMNEKKKHPILDTLRDIYRCAVQEMRAIFGDIGVMTFIFLVPLAYPLLYTFLYTNETVREVPTVAVDESPTPLSREFIRMVDASPDVKIAYRAADLTQAQQLLARKKAYGIVYIPSDFEKKIARGEQTTVSLYCDMSSLLYYKALLATLTDVSLEMGREIEIQNMAGASREEELTSSMPIENRWTTMYNVHSGFAAFLIPAILMVILQQTMLLGIGMTTGTARQERNLRKLLASTRGSILDSMAGRSAAYTLLYIAITAYMIVVVPGIFSIPRVGDMGTKVLFLLPYILSCTFFAMFLASGLRTRESCMPAFVFTSVPFLFISGVSWPMAAVPTVWKIVGWFIPSSQAIQGFVKINTMGADLTDVRFEYLSLWALTLLYAGLTYLAYRRLQRRYGTLPPLKSAQN